MEVKAGVHLAADQEIGREWRGWTRVCLEEESPAAEGEQVRQAVGAGRQ